MLYKEPLNAFNPNWHEVRRRGWLVVFGEGVGSILPFLCKWTQEFVPYQIGKKEEEEGRGHDKENY